MITDAAELLIVYHAKELAERDPNLAIYECRDLRITKAAGLDDLAWAIYKQGDCSRGDARGFFELLEKYINHE